MPKKKKEITLDQIEKDVDAYKKQQKQKPLTKNDLEEFIKRINLKKIPSKETIKKEYAPFTPAETTTIPQQPPEETKQLQPNERKQIAYQLYKDAKTISIVCLIAIIFPLVIIFVTMIDPMYAMIIALVGIIFPIFIFMKMIGIQTRAYKKYGWKPLFQFNPQTPPYQPYQQKGPQKPKQQQPGGGFF